MTEETLKCPLCEEKMEIIKEGHFEKLKLIPNEHIYSCRTVGCFQAHLKFTRFLTRYLQNQIDSIKQKAYSEGYEKSKEDAVKQREVSK